MKAEISLGLLLECHPFLFLVFKQYSGMGELVQTVMVSCSFSVSSPTVSKHSKQWVFRGRHLNNNCDISSSFFSPQLLFLLFLRRSLVTSQDQY